MDEPVYLWQLIWYQDLGENDVKIGGVKAVNMQTE